MEVKRNALSKGLSDRAAHSHPHDGWVILYNINPSTCQLLLGLRGNRVHGQFSGTVRCPNAILHKCCLELHKLKSKRFYSSKLWGTDSVMRKFIVLPVLSVWKALFYGASRALALVSEHIILHFYKRTSHLEIMENGFVPSPFSNLFRDYGRLCK